MKSDELVMHDGKCLFCGSALQWSAMVGHIECGCEQAIEYYQLRQRTQALLAITIVRKRFMLKDERVKYLRAELAALEALTDDKPSTHSQTPQLPSTN